MMKKTIISLLLVLSLIGMTGVTSLAAVPSAVDIYEEHMCLYKTFENDNISQELAILFRATRRLLKLNRLWVRTEAAVQLA